ncbi:MAG: hypothetical protein ISN26_03080, partial [Betaproteobacteria bacterium AqS2]|nr:hypothetical protein [Betaproteobacteria bacterium AqS2]
MRYSIKNTTLGFELTVNGQGTKGTSVTANSSRSFRTVGPGIQHVEILHSGTNLTAGTHVITIEVENRGGTLTTSRGIGCSAGEKRDIEFTITVAEVWQTLFLHSSVANDDLTVAELNAVTRAEDFPETGLAIHVDAAGCSYAAATDSGGLFVLVAHDVDTDARGGGSTFLVPITEMDYAKVEFRNANDTFSVGTLTILITLSAPGCPSTPDPLTLTWAVTVSDPWTDQGSHSDEAASAFSPLIIGASTARTETGLAFHQSPSACRQIDVALAAGAPDSVELVRYDGNSPASNAALSNIHMESGN